MEGEGIEICSIVIGGDVCGMGKGLGGMGL